MKNLHFLTPVLVVLLSLSNSLQSQYIDQVFKAFGAPGESNAETAKAMIQTQDGGFVLAGSQAGQAYLMKVGLCGDSLWQQTFTYGTLSIFNDLIEMQDGTLLAIGTCENCLEEEEVSKMLLLKTSPSGELLRDTLLGLPEKNSVGNAIAQHDNGDLLLAGYTGRGGFAGVSGHVYRLDSNLNYLWDRFYDKFYFDYFSDLVPTADGGIGLTGHGFNGGTPDHLLVFKTDSAGTVEWSSTFLMDSLTTGVQNTGNALVQLPNGNLLICGTVYVDAVAKNDLLAIEYDINSGDVVQTATFGSPGEYDDVGYDVQTATDGQILIGGKEGGWAGFDRALVLLLDDQLNETGRHYFSSQGFADNAWSVIPLSENGEEFAFCGQRYYYSIGADLTFGKYAQPGYRVTFSQLPQHKQLYPRSLVTNKGTVHIAGEINDPAQTYKEIRLKAHRNGVALSPILTIPLEWSNGMTSFTVDYEIPAELANYKIEVYGFDCESETLEACVRELVAGDAYIIQGQSNAVASSYLSGGDQANAINQSPFIRVYGSGGENGYQPAWFIGDGDADPTQNGNTGQWGLRLARRIIDSFSVPVAIFNGAKGGAESNYFMPQPALPPDSSNYGRLLKRIQEAGLESHIRSLFWFQGESDIYSHNSTAVYKQRLNDLIEAWYQDYPSIEKFYLFQIRNGCFNAPAASALNIMEAQRQLAVELPDVGIMSSTAVAHLGCHYPYEGGYEALANRLFRLVARDLYGMDIGTNVEPPQIVAATLTDSVTISLEMKNVADDLIWEPGSEADFILHGTSATVVGGSTSDNSVLLELSGYPAGLTGISYAGHIQTDTPFITNGNGVGMLCFRDFPVAVEITPTLVSDEPSEQLKVSAYPNPVRGQLFTLQVSADQPQTMDLSFYNAIGQMVLFNQVEVQEGQTQFGLEAPTVPGVYFLKVSSDEGYRQGIQLVVQQE